MDEMVEEMKYKWNFLNSYIKQRINIDDIQHITSTHSDDLSEMNGLLEAIIDFCTVENPLSQKLLIKDKT